TVVVALVLLSTFIGGTFATPNIQQVFVSNFPSNQQVTVSNFPKNQNTTTTNLPLDASGNVRVVVETSKISPTTIYLLRNATVIVGSPAGTLLSLGNVSSIGYHEIDVQAHFVSTLGLANPITLYATSAPDASFPGQGSLTADAAIIDNVHQGGGSFTVYIHPPGHPSDFGT